ncbi:MAG: HIT domain-containing protein [archaeon]|jgi:histidine triad (HIT) family protein
MKEKDFFDKDCLFCKFASHKLDTAIVYETKKIIAFIDINPAGKLVGHTLIMPKKHYPLIEEVGDKTLCELILAIKKIVPAIKEVSGSDGTNIVQNNGKAAGQAINHAHLHIIPRKHGDGIYFDEKRRKLVPMEQLEAAKAIKEELERQKSSKKTRKIN